MKDRKLYGAITGLILSAFLFTGCGSVAQVSMQTGPAESSVLSESGKPYKELTGKVVVFGTSIWANEPGPTGIASRLEDLTSFQVTDYSMPGGLATRIEGDSFSDISLVSILLYNKDRYSKKMSDALPFSKDDSYEYFEDGSHLTDLGRKIYSEYLAEHIYDYYYGQDDVMVNYISRKQG